MHCYSSAVRTIPDSRRIRSWIAERGAKTAVVVGGGFIGLEIVENLIHRELSVTALEKLPQVMPPLDPELAVPLMEHLSAKGRAAPFWATAWRASKRARRWHGRCSGEWSSSVSSRADDASRSSSGLLISAILAHFFSSLRRLLQLVQSIFTRNLLAQVLRSDWSQHPR